MSRLVSKGKKNWAREVVLVTRNQMKEMRKRAMKARYDNMSSFVQELLDAHSYCTSNNLQFRPVPMQNAQPSMQDA